MYVEQSDAVFMKHWGDFMKDVIYDGTVYATRCALRSPLIFTDRLKATL